MGLRNNKNTTYIRGAIHCGIAKIRLGDEAQVPAVESSQCEAEHH